MNDTDPPRRPRTRRLGADLIETVLVGRVTERDARAFAADYASLGGALIWLFDGTLATSYEPGAIDVAAAAFVRARAGPLARIVAVTDRRMLRMAAAVAAMVSRVEIEVFSTRAAADAALRRKEP